MLKSQSIDINYILDIQMYQLPDGVPSELVLTERIESSHIESLNIDFERDYCLQITFKNGSIYEYDLANNTFNWNPVEIWGALLLGFNQEQNKSRVELPQFSNSVSSSEYRSVGVAFYKLVRSKCPFRKVL